MIIDYLTLAIVLFYFTIASIEDIKKREVYDYINYSFTFIIIIIGIFDSIIKNSFEPIESVGFGILIGFSLGSILYYSKIWGGGDAKFLIGFSSASYYLINLVKNKIDYYMYYNYFINNFSNFLNLFLNTFLEIIMYLDIFFIFISLIFLIIKILDAIIKKIHREKKRELREIKNIVFLNSILLFLYLGLYLNLKSNFLIPIGVISFILIFFAEEDIFDSIYIKINKFIFELKEGDKLEKNIIHDKKKLICEDNMKFGLDKADIIRLKETLPKHREVKVKKIIPYSVLVILNFTIYLFKIINLNKVNVDIVGFLLKFLLLSFLVGGVLVLFLIIFIGLKNIKKIKIKMKKEIKYFLYFLTVLTLILSIFDLKMIIFFLLILIYPFFKLTKEIEKLTFIKEKKIEDIVPGDWVVEDIFVNKKLIYSVDDFKLGIDEFQLKKLNELSKKHREFQKIYVKDGIAFIPPLFLGFLLILLLI